MATSYCLCNVNAQKRVAVCYGACTGACNQPNRGEINIREPEITESYDMPATILIHEQQFLDYWQGCRCRATRAIGEGLPMQQMN